MPCPPIAASSERQDRTNAADDDDDLLSSRWSKNKNLKNRHKTEEEGPCCCWSSSHRDGSSFCAADWRQGSLKKKSPLLPLATHATKASSFFRVIGLFKSGRLRAGGWFSLGLSFYNFCIERTTFELLWWKKENWGLRENFLSRLLINEPRVKRFCSYGNMVLLRRSKLPRFMLYNAPGSMTWSTHSFESCSSYPRGWKHILFVNNFQWGYAYVVLHLLFV